jgi:hypothetical protein
VKKLDLVTVVLVAATNDVEDLKPLMPAVNEAFSNIHAGELIYIRR